ncbi:MAG: hypothetical protein ACE5Q6_04380, partial [Dehalococcoidia bacterium]
DPKTTNGTADGQSTAAPSTEVVEDPEPVEEPPPEPEQPPPPEPEPPATEPEQPAPESAGETDPEAEAEAEAEAETPEPVVAEVALASVEEARDLVWAHLSQCLSLDATELEAYKIRENYFVRAVGEAPDKYGIWRVDGANGNITPHNIRAREWAPLISPECSPETVAELLGMTAATSVEIAVADGDQAITLLWSNLVKCYSAIQVEDFQAVQNPTESEWIITAKEDVESNYGVWRVGIDGSIIPDNGQANLLYGQVSAGMC